MAILIVDDLEINRKILVQILSAAKYHELIEAENSFQVQKTLEKSYSDNRTVDLILLDILLDEENGIDLCRSIKNNMKFKDIPIIMVTAQNDNTDLTEAFEAGAMDFISRPVRKDELLARVSSAIRLKKEMDKTKIRENQLQESEEKFRKFYEAAFKATSEGITIHKNGVILDANHSFARMFGYNLSEVIGSHLLRYVQDSSVALLHYHLDGNHEEIIEISGRRKDNSTFFAEVLGRVIPYSAGYARVAAFRDITERKRSEEALHSSLEALHSSEERYALAMRGANDGLWDWNLKGNTIYFSERWKNMLGIPANENMFRPSNWFDRVHPQDRDKTHRALEEHLKGLTSHFEIEHRIINVNGDYRWMLSRGIALRDLNGESYRMAGSMTDITDRKKAEAQLLHDALHDSLTGLPNRTLFLDRLQHAMDIRKRSGSGLFAIMFIDLDRFKMVNDSLGHLVGDELLKSIAQRLQQHVRTGDTIARLGGDEFAVLMENIRNYEEATEVADRLNRLLNKSIILNSQEIFPSASIGITYSDMGYEKPDELLRDADTAMYAAKGQGRNRAVVFSQAMRSFAENSLKLETELRRAIDANEFVTYFQPILSLSTGKITKLEALVRWMHPTRGLVRPVDFISLAEETGLIAEIGLQVLDQSALALAKWIKQGFDQLVVSFNISAGQFQDNELGKKLLEIITAHKLEPKQFKIEITESVAMVGLETTLRTLTELSNLGFSIAIDDFGTGYSS
ncbi:MAG: diguanylate cyclase, partial [Leptospiraceae bacterium]|nr:diguanylate cyclase [Leptospiraceae bacterium]